MSLLRFVGRLMYSAYFVADGYSLATKPDKYADEIALTTDRLAPTVQSFLPPDAADRVPEDPRTWTRLLGATQILGGAMYATGIMRRPGALLLTAATLPRVVAAARSDEKLSALAPLALAGAGLVATQDTAGKPSLLYRANKGADFLGREARHAARQAKREAKMNAKLAKKQAQHLATEAELAVEKGRRGFLDFLR